MIVGAATVRGAALGAGADAPSRDLEEGAACVLPCYVPCGPERVEPGRRAHVVAALLAKLPFVAHLLALVVCVRSQEKGQSAGCAM